jgi:predicted NBD/HSP70 family sugar kinase
MKQVNIDENNLNVATQVEEKLTGYRNIALFGVDSRDSDLGKGNRSDCIIIASINNDTKEINLVSVYRDTYVDIDGYGLDKITHAYSYGGPELALKTLNKNLDLNIKEFDIGKELKEKYKTTIKIKNDGKCAGLAEKKYGALRIYDDCAFLCIGTGVGSAIFLGGELLEPKNSSGFELGHMIIDKNGKLCNCGQKGCFETYASMKRFKQEAINRLKLGNNKEIQAEEVQNYIRNNIEKKDVKEFVEEYLENVSIGLINIINIFEPEAICFGGSFSYYEDIFIPRLYNILKGRTFNKESKVKLLPAKLKNDAGIIGAAEI